MEYLGKIFVKQFNTDFNLCMDGTNVMAVHSDLGCWGTDLKTKDYEKQAKFVWFVCTMYSNENMQSINGIDKISMSYEEYKKLVNNYNRLVDKIYDIKDQIETCIGRLNRLRDQFKVTYFSELQNLAPVDPVKKFVAAEMTLNRLIDRHSFKLDSELKNGKDDYSLQNTFDFFIADIGDIDWRQFVKHNKDSLYNYDSMLQWRGLTVERMVANKTAIEDQFYSIFLRSSLTEQIKQLEERVTQMQDIYKLASKTETQYKKYVKKLEDDIDSGIFQKAVQAELDSVCANVKDMDIGL